MVVDAKRLVVEEVERLPEHTVMQELLFGEDEIELAILTQSLKESGQRSEVHWRDAAAKQL